MREKGKDTGSDRVDMKFEMKFEQGCSQRGPSPGIDILIGLACDKKTIYFLAPAESQWKVVELQSPKSPK